MSTDRFDLSITPLDTKILYCTMDLKRIIITDTTLNAVDFQWLPQVQRYSDQTYKTVDASFLYIRLWMSPSSIQNDGYKIWHVTRNHNYSWRNVELHSQLQTDSGGIFMIWWAAWKQSASYLRSSGYVKMLFSNPQTSRPMIWRWHVSFHERKCCSFGSASKPVREFIYTILNLFIKLT